MAKPSLLKTIALFTALGFTSYIFYIISSQIKNELNPGVANENPRKSYKFK